MRLSCAIDDLRITLDAPARRLDPVARQRLDALWTRETERNPRLFDGPVLSAVEVDAVSGHIRCRRATYRELVAHPIVDTGVLQVSVTGVCVSQRGGMDRVLLGRRGRETRIYGGMWELAPSGGVDPPTRRSSEDAAEMSGRDAWRYLMLEMEEELGAELWLTESIEPTAPMCLCADEHARSLDIVFQVVIDDADADAVGSDRSGVSAAWEYEAVRWVGRDEVKDFDARHAAEIIGPSRAILRWMGWV